MQLFLRGPTHMGWAQFIVQNLTDARARFQLQTRARQKKKRDFLGAILALLWCAHGVTFYWIAVYWLQFLMSLKVPIGIRVFVTLRHFASQCHVLSRSGFWS